MYGDKIGGEGHKYIRVETRIALKEIK